MFSKFELIFFAVFFLFEAGNYHRILVGCDKVFSADHHIELTQAEIDVANTSVKLNQDKNVDFGIKKESKNETIPGNA